MTKLRELYKCNICGNVVEIAHAGATALVCCGEAMDKLEATTEDKGREKHLPVVTETDSGIRVEVGSVHHPMEEKHYIQFIEVLTDDKIHRKELDGAETPAAEFAVAKKDVQEVRSYCNIHGLWSV